jgi:hypothetical protein
MSAFGKSEGGGRRSMARSAAPLTVVLATLTSSRSATLANVSSTGARVRAHNLPKMGEDVVVNIDRVQAFGTVAWSESGECGIAFDHPLDPADESYLCEMVAASRGLPPDMRAAFENWIVGAGR